MLSQRCGDGTRALALALVGGDQLLLAEGHADVVEALEQAMLAERIDLELHHAAVGLFAEMRYLDDGSPNPEFVLNKAGYKNAKILVAGDNFGCGSSREHAPWALLDYGIRCVISTDFADIFYNNCFKNGILPIKVSPEDLEKLMDDARRGANATLTVDLAAQEIKGPDGGTVRFEIDAFRKHCLIEGLDDIGLTMVEAGAIDSFESNAASARPWN